MDMLLAAGVPLSKIINSTFGSGELKGFDESAVEKIYGEFKNQAHFVGSDKLLCVYPDEEWSDPAGEGNANITNKSLRFSLSGTVRFIMVLQYLRKGSIVNIYLCDSSGNAIQTWSTGVAPYTSYDLEVEAPFDVQKDTDYKILLQVVTGGADSVEMDEPNLRICADVSTIASPINYI